MLQDEWETRKTVDFAQNFELVSKEGRNIMGVWKESWYDREGREKWASKEGQNFATAEEWKEEWQEKEGGLDKTCTKWGRSGGEEWNEAWGEHLAGDKKEKWTNKWVFDKATGEKRGQSWGHEYNNGMEPKRHWVESWDSQGNIVKREEHY